MKWYTIEWFGGFKTECEECHHYAVGNSEKEARAYMRAHLTDYWCPFCTTCSHEKEAVEKGDPDLSLTNRIRFLEEQNKKLQEGAGSWKEAWIHLREIIGWLWWHHPAIDDDKQRAYYQANLRALEAKQALDNIRP